MLIGYARCSTDAQDLAAQIAALRKRGVRVKDIHTDQGLSGANRARPGLEKALTACREGDVLVVTALDRLGRSVRDLHDIADELAAAGCALDIGGARHDPADPMGRLFFTLLAAFAEFEREIMRARTREGLAVARARGRLKGRKPKLSPAQQAHVRRLVAAGEHTPTQVAELLGVSRTTIYRLLAAG